MKIEDYFGDWLKVIDIPVLNLTLKTINYLYQHFDVTPEYKDIFKAFTLCKRKDCMVVFLGQDPYPQKGVATGIAFGNNKEPISPSLEVIKEACINYEIPHKPYVFDNTLESWGKQGILLLNSSLTCEVNKPGSHIIRWREFIKRVLIGLSTYNPGLIYVLFGNQALTYAPFINSNNTIIKVKHPAYYYRTKTKMPYELFENINKELMRKYGLKVKWYHEIDEEETESNSSQEEENEDSLNSSNI